MAKLPIAPFEKILKENGAKRVSFSAGEALAEIMGELAGEISKNASIMAEHAGRKTQFLGKFVSKLQIVQTEWCRLCDQQDEVRTPDRFDDRAGGARRRIDDHRLVRV